MNKNGVWFKIQNFNDVTLEEIYTSIGWLERILLELNIPQNKCAQRGN